jgi:lipopolysaccharide export system ATP-binding protein
VVLSGLSKSHAMTGWRVGWAIGPEALIEHFDNLALCMLYGLSGFVQEGALTALTEGDGAVERMRKSYRRRPVIRDVSLDLARGEVVALLGPNGSGKTTCFYNIAGLIAPDAGQVTIDGRDVTGLPMYRRARLGIGYLPQEVSIFRGLSVEDNILAVLEITESDIHKRRERLEELLSEFSITHLRRAPALALSGGERRRVEIARCLAANPKYLLLDEPFAGVDPISVGDIRNLVHDLKSRGIGVLITDHNVRETLEIVDRAYILHDGTVLMSGTADEVVRDDNVRRVYLGQSFRIS